MTAGNRPLQDPLTSRAIDLLAKFINLFESKGWLNQTFRIKRRNRKYRICCKESEFLAYRINDHVGVSKGYPGWPVCLITHEQLIEDADVSALGSTEPTAQEWLDCLTEEDFDLLEEGGE